jgi:hypothetical protein
MGKKLGEMIAEKANNKTQYLNQPLNKKTEAV